MKKLTLAAAAAAGLMASALTGGTAAAAGKTFVSIGTGGPTGVYFATGNAICRLIHKEAAEGRKSGQKHGIRCSAPSTGGSNYNIGQIMEGELEFGVAQSDWQYHAVNGSSKWEGNKQPKLRAVFSVHPEPFQVVAAKGSGIKSWADLKGKRVNIGNPGSGQRGTMEALMTQAGWTKDTFSQVTELTSTEHSKALCDGKIDAFVYTVGVPNAGVAVATDGCDGYIVDLSGAKAVKDFAGDKPYYAWATLPKGTYKSTTADVTTFGPKATFVTSSDVPDEVVYKVVKAVFENLEDFRKLHPAFANLKAEEMVKDANSAPIHSGAMKYYKEKGLM